jgi:hypothetical protein
MLLMEESAVPIAALPLAEFKAHLRLGTGFADDDIQDPVLEGFLRAALAAIEGRTGKVLIEREFSWVLHDWQDASGQRRLRTARSAALSLSLLAAVLLSTPAWFAAFAWATGQTPVVLALIGVLLATGYAFGVGQLGLLARAVTVSERTESECDGSDAG